MCPPTCIIHTGRVHVHKEKRGGQGTFLVYFWVLSEVWYNFILTTPYRTGMVRFYQRENPGSTRALKKTGLGGEQLGSNPVCHGHIQEVRSQKQQACLHPQYS